MKRSCQGTQLLGDEAAGDETAEGNAFAEKTHLLKNQLCYNIIFCIILLTSNII